MIDGLSYAFVLDVFRRIQKLHGLKKCAVTFWPQQHPRFQLNTEYTSNWIENEELGPSNAHLVFGYIDDKPWLYFDHGWGSNVYTVERNINSGLGIKP